MTEKLFEQITIVGLGLIGSSLARAIASRGLAGTIIGLDTDPSVRAKARELQLCDRIEGDSEAAVRDGDLVIICVPVGAFESVARALAPHLKDGAIVSDVGSVKRAALASIAPHMPPGTYFVPGHPVAGVERSGPEAGDGDLFEGRWCILTPDERTDKAAVARLEKFWLALGSHVQIMDAEHHDLVLAVTSHLPHLIAYNIVGTAADLEEVTKSEVIKFSAGGFRDFTRIAASDPTMWRDVFLNNKDAVLEVLGRFSEDLAMLQRAIRWGDGDTLFELFSRTRAIRKGVIEAGQDTDQPDFGRTLADRMAHTGDGGGETREDRGDPADR